MEYSLAIIKPDTVRNRRISEVIRRLEANRITILDMKMVRLTKETAEQFYEVHRGKWFFERCVNFMVTGPIVVLILAGDNVISRYRTLMGYTNSRRALPGTIRSEIGRDKTINAVHGSDSPQTAETEISFFFPGWRRLHNLPRD